MRKRIQWAQGFFEGLQTLMPTSAVLTCVYPPQRPRPNPLPVCPLPPTIPSLYQPAYKELTNNNLQAKCQEVFNGLEMTEDEAAYLAEAAKLQSKSLIWFEHRRARITLITALKFHTVCHTSITSPSRSLVQQILTVGGNVTSFPLVKLGITSLAPRNAMSSVIVKPLSARTVSPCSTMSKNPLCCVKTLSDTRQPQHLDKKENIPLGVIPIKNLLGFTSAFKTQTSPLVAHISTVRTCPLCTHAHNIRKWHSSQINNHSDCLGTRQVHAWTHELTNLAASVRLARSLPIVVAKAYVIGKALHLAAYL